VNRRVTVDLVGSQVSSSVCQVLVKQHTNVLDFFETSLLGVKPTDDRARLVAFKKWSLDVFTSMSLFQKASKVVDEFLDMLNNVNGLWAIVTTAKTVGGTQRVSSSTFLKLEEVARNVQLSLGILDVGDFKYVPLTQEFVWHFAIRMRNLRLYNGLSKLVLCRIAIATLEYIIEDKLPLIL